MAAIEGRERRTAKSSSGKTAIPGVGPPPGAVQPPLTDMTTRPITHPTSRLEDPPPYPRAAALLAKVILGLFALAFLLVPVRLSRGNASAPVWLSSLAAQPWTITLEHVAAAAVLPLLFWAGWVLTVQCWRAPVDPATFTSRLRSHGASLFVALAVTAGALWWQGSWEMAQALFLQEGASRLDVLKRCLPAQEAEQFRACMLANGRAEMRQYTDAALTNLVGVLLVCAAHAIDVWRELRGGAAKGGGDGA